MSTYFLKVAGYSHIPLVFQDEAGNCFGAKIPGGIKFSSKSSRLVINSHSVGRPRGGDLEPGI